MKIQVIGSTPPCARCKATENVVKSVVEELGYEGIEVEKLDVFSQEAEALGLLMTPATVIEGKILKMGGVPSRDEVKRAIEKIREADG
jgi:small redox-active disulfide protein 2